MPGTNDQEQERRTVPLRLTIEERAEGKGPRLVGHAAVWRTLSADLGGFREEIEPGFFSQVLDNDVRALWNHDANLVLGRTKSGTLRLEEDKEGLAVEIEPPDTGWARDSMVTMRRGDVDQMSFTFTVLPDGARWRQGEDGRLVRTLLPGGCGRLIDVAPVTYPAYAETSVSVRAHVAAAARRDGQDPTGHAGQGARGAGGDEDPEVQVRLGLMRRRLELAELE